jgi:hypothetical protein
MAAEEEDDTSAPQAPMPPNELAGYAVIATVCSTGLLVAAAAWTTYMHRSRKQGQLPLINEKEQAKRGASRPRKLSTVEMPEDDDAHVEVCLVPVEQTRSEEQLLQC